MKKLLFVLFALISVHLYAQESPDEIQDTSWKKVYRETPPLINDLVHTKLDVKFDYDKAYMYGKAVITLQPHFYATDSLALDAKGMDIKKVAIVKGGSMNNLKYDYDGMTLDIQLDKTYKGGEKYTIYIDYTSKPNEYTGK